MLIRYMSDLHLEFDYNQLKSDISPGNVLILAGDIISARFLNINRTDKNSRNIRKKLDHIIDNWFPKFDKILYVMGNHEHYGSFYSDTKSILENYFKYKNCTNIHVLENEYIIHDDIVFIGSTLWTDYDNENPLAINAIQYGMQDYKWIFMKKELESGKKISHKILPNDLLKDHKNTVCFINDTLMKYNNKKCIVLTHHAPILQGINPDHVGGDLDYAYASNLNEMILNNGNCKAWIFGHTHIRYDNLIGDTKVLSNAHGYGWYEDYLVKSFDPNTYFEI